MILHIFNNQKKFFLDYFIMLERNQFDLNQFILCHYGPECKEIYSLNLNQYIPLGNFFNFFSAIKLFRAMKDSDKIIIHSLASPILLIYLACFKSFSYKTIWVMWGKDLYFIHQIKHPLFWHKIYEFLRKKAIKKIYHTVSIIKEDYELLKLWYETKADNIECNNLYPYAIDYSSQPIVKNRKYIIWLGNSASFSNNHMDILELLDTVNAMVEKIICPLSYGGSKIYKKRVIKYGKKLFGERFHPLVDFLPKDAFFNIMQSTNIGIFNYNRQEGLGNIWSLIFKNKTIYINTDTTTGSFFSRIGIKVKDISSIAIDGLNCFDDETIVNNSNILHSYINEGNSVKAWKNILNLKLE